jgi:hypothetical protein
MQQFDIVSKAFGLQGSLLLRVLVFHPQLLVLLFQILDASFVHFLSRSVLFLPQQQTSIGPGETQSNHTQPIRNTQ